MSLARSRTRAARSGVERTNHEATAPLTNRVKVIKTINNSKEWRYNDTKDNPADRASRGLNAEELMKFNWFSGPAFLWEKEIPSSEEEIPNMQIGRPEVKATVHVATVKEPFSLIDCVSKCSSWTKAVGVVSHLKRPFKKNKPKTVATTVAEQQDDEWHIFKEIQRRAFKNEIASLSHKEWDAKISRQSSLLRLDHAFRYCGMDCFGPFSIKEGRREFKRYAVIFTCMSSRAVH